MSYRTISEIIACLLIFLFTYTALSKFAGHSYFNAQLSLYPYIKRVHTFLSWVIPITETFIVGLLIFPNMRWIGFYASFLLLLTFTGYLIIMVSSGVNLPCSCGGVLRRLGWKQHIVFNSVFIVLAIYAIMQESKTGTRRSIL